MKFYKTLKNTKTNTKYACFRQIMKTEAINHLIKQFKFEMKSPLNITTNGCCGKQFQLQSQSQFTIICKYIIILSIIFM